MRKLLLNLFALSVMGLCAQTPALKPARTAATASKPVTISTSRVIDGSQSSLRSASDTKKQQKHPILLRGADVVEMNQEKGQAIVLEKKRPSNLRSLATDTGFVRNEVTRFLASSSGMFYLTNPENIRINKVEVDKRGTLTGRGEQIFKGYPVYGADFTFNISSETERFSGRTVEESKIVASAATLDSDLAIQTLRKDLQEKTKVRTLTKAELKLVGGTQAKVDTLYYPTADGLYRLSFRISYRPNLVEEWIYFINATDGTIISRYNNTKGGWEKKTFTGEDLNGVRQSIHTAYNTDENIYYLQNKAEEMYDPENETGTILILDANFTNATNLETEPCTSKQNEWSPLHVSTMWGITQTYHYFKNTFGRNSLDGEGGNIIGIINMNDSETGGPMDNAYWNGAYMAFGNGNKILKPLAGALDVIGHELGHGVIDKTAGLVYRDQSGAMNESFADIFGAMIDREDWQIGEDITKPEVFPSGALRDLSNPHNGYISSKEDNWQPAHTSEIYTGEEDNGGVHINSGILNFAYYKYATATSKEEAEQVYYHALTHYLTATSRFTDLRLAIIRSARELYGEKNAACAAKAFDEVGIWEDEASLPGMSELDPNPGDECLAANIKDPESGCVRLMSYNTVTKEYTLISEMPALTTPSVTDNGKTLLYVGEDYKIYRCDLEKGNCEIYSEETPFANVAISKDGKRVAAVAYSGDGPNIYVRNLDDKEWIAFGLSTPGTEGTTYDVKYADHIEFDLSGENLLYDAYNETSQFSFWNIGVLEVWDADMEDWSEGMIAILFTYNNGISVGNPTFFKNSPDKFIFEAINSKGWVELALASFDREILSNIMTPLSQPAYPTLGIKDEYIALMAYDEEEDEATVFHVALSEDKNSFIIPEDEEDMVFPLGAETDARYPVYYGTGERDLGKKPEVSFQAMNRKGEAPLTITFEDLSQYDPTSWTWTFEGGTPATSDEENPTVVYETPGSYDVTLTVSNAYGTSTVTKKDYIVVGGDPTSVEEVAIKQVSVHPNPATTYVIAEGVEQGPVLVYSATGKSYANLSVTWLDEQSVRVDVSSLPEGLYILKFKNGSAKFMKQMNY